MSYEESTPLMARNSNEQQQQEFDERQLYSPLLQENIHMVEQICNKLKYRINLPSEFTNNRVQLYPDLPTKEFLAESVRKYNRSFIVNWGISLMRQILSNCLNHTDILGFLNIGAMHIISAEQLGMLLHHSYVVQEPLNIEKLKKFDIKKYLHDQKFGANSHVLINNNLVPKSAIQWQPKDTTIKIPISQKSQQQQQQQSATTTTTLTKSNSKNNNKASILDSCPTAVCPQKISTYQTDEALDLTSQSATVLMQTHSLTAPGDRTKSLLTRCNNPTKKNLAASILGVNTTCDTSDDDNEEEEQNQQQQQQSCCDKPLQTELNSDEASIAAIHALLDDNAPLSPFDHQPHITSYNEDDDNLYNPNNNIETKSYLQTYDPTQKFGAALDVGAGSGRIAEILSPIFNQIECTEVSEQMIKQIQKRGFVAHYVDDIDNIYPKTKKYDVICLFNLIDRCDEPITLLGQLHGRIKSALDEQRDHLTNNNNKKQNQTSSPALSQKSRTSYHNSDVNSSTYYNPNGRVVIAVPLPLKPAVEMTLADKSTTWRDPKQRIDPPGACPGCISFEESFQHLVCNIIDPCGYDVLSYSVLPYLSEGNEAATHFVLNDIILVLAPKVQ